MADLNLTLKTGLSMQKLSKRPIANIKSNWPKSSHSNLDGRRWLILKQHDGSGMIFPQTARNSSLLMPRKILTTDTSKQHLSTSYPYTSPLDPNSDIASGYGDLVNNLVQIPKCYKS